MFARCEDCRRDMGPGGPPLCQGCLAERNIRALDAQRETLLRRHAARRQAGAPRALRVGGWR